MSLLTSTEWIVLVLALITFGLDAFAIRKVFISQFYEPAQRWAQTTMILLVPIFGAYLALYLAREHTPLFQSPPVDHVRDIDPTCSDIDYRG